jgi:hypothetical protein
MLFWQRQKNYRPIYTVLCVSDLWKILSVWICESKCCVNNSGFRFLYNDHDAVCKCNHPLHNSSWLIFVDLYITILGTYLNDKNYMYQYLALMITKYTKMKYNWSYVQ